MGFSSGRVFITVLLGFVALSLLWTESAYGWSWYRVHGRDLNGPDLNGEVLEGRSVIGVSLNQVLLDDQALRSVKLKKTRFQGVNANGRKFRNRAFVGAVFTATLDNDETLALRIDDIKRTRERFFKDTYQYVVSYPTQTDRLSLCGLDDQGQPIPAIPINGRWDFRQGELGGGSYIEDSESFTFACDRYVIAKCVMAGYKPWRKAWVCNQYGKCKKQSLVSHLQACTRLLRADYCGDGTPHTVDGIEINMYDGVGISKDVYMWLFEAEWNTDGAVCVVNERIPGFEPEAECLEYLRQDECGDPSHIFFGTLLFSEIIYDE